MLEVYVLFVSVHFIADFWLQSDTLVRKKKEKFRYLLLHILIHSVITTGVLLLFQVDNLLLVLPLAFAQHLMIDFTNIKLEEEGYTEYKLFIIDQLLHLSALLAISALAEVNAQIFYDELLGMFHIILITLIGVIGVTGFSKVLINKLMDYLIKENPEHKDEFKDSVKHSGTIIGITERLIILILIIINQPLGVGFLLTIKSWLRIKSEKRLEYVLIGTLISFLLAILFAIFVRQIFVEIDLL